jgi:hypothetical protein
VADVQAFCDAVRTTVRFCAASPQVWWISIVEGIYASVLFAFVSRYDSSDHFCWNSYFRNLQTKEMESLRIWGRQTMYCWRMRIWKRFEFRSK